MRKWLVLFMWVLVLQIPLDKWKEVSEQKREEVRYLATQEHCRKEAKRGFVRFRIWEEIKNGMWNLHITGEKQEV